MKHQERPQKKTKKKEEFFLPTSTLLRGRGDSNRPAHQHHRGGGGGGGTTTTTTTTRTTTLPVVRSSRRRGGRGRQKHRRLPSIRPQSPHGTAGGPRADYDDNHNDRDGGRDGGGSASVAGSSSAVAVIGADGAPPPPPPLPSALEGPRATKKRKKATTTTVTKRPREEEEEEGAKQFPKASTLPPAPTTLLNESSSLAVGTPVHAGRGGGARRLGLSWWNTGGAGAAAAAASSSSSPSSDLPNDDAEDVTVVRKRRKHGKRNTDDNDEDAWEEEEGSHERRRLRRLRRLRQECVAFLPPVAAARPTPLQERVWQVALVDVGDHHDKDHATTASSNVRLRSCVVLGPTASGKTLAYGVPLLRKVQGKSVAVEVASSFSRDSHRGIGGGSSIGALVAVPTRELALQVTSDLERAVLRAVTTVGTSATTEAHPPASQPTTPVAIVACYGGVDKTRQWESLLRAASSKGGGFVVVGTPGRLLDLLLDPKPQHPKQSPPLLRPAGGDVRTFSDPGLVATGGGRASADRAHLRSAIVCASIDEADRMGLQPDLAQQVSTLLESLHRMESLFLASATMPYRVQKQWDDWIRQTPTISAAATNADTRCAVVRLESSKSSPESSPEDGCVGDGEGAVAVVLPAPAAPARTDGTGSCATTASADSTTADNLASAENEGVAGHDWRARIPAHVEQVVHVCADHKKPRKLLKTLQTLRDSGKKRKSIEKGRTQYSSSSCGIVFFNTVKRLRDVAHLLRKEKCHSLPAFGELHGRLDQAERERTLRCFRSGRIPVLLATDVAARGLHVDHAAFVVNYDFPSSLEQYVHRCGRVGRWQTDGGVATKATAAVPLRGAVAYSYFPRRFAPLAPDLIRLLESCGQWVDPNLRELAAAAAYEKLTRPGPGRTDDDDHGDDLPPGPDDGDAHLAKTQGVRCHNNKDQADSDDEFGALSGLRIALRRASHVSDASSEEDDDTEKDNSGVGGGGE